MVTAIRLFIGMSSWKEDWEKVDTLCPNCNQVTIRAKGINRQNLKRLVEWRKPTYVEVIVLVFILLFFLSTIAYREDTKVCRAFVQEDIKYWKALNITPHSPLNLSNSSLQIPELNLSIFSNG